MAFRTPQTPEQPPSYPYWASPANEVLDKAGRDKRWNAYVEGQMTKTFNYGHDPSCPSDLPPYKWYQRWAFVAAHVWWLIFTIPLVAIVAYVAWGGVVAFVTSGVAPFLVAAAGVCGAWLWLITPKKQEETR